MGWLLGEAKGCGFGVPERANEKRPENEGWWSKIEGSPWLLSRKRKIAALGCWKAEADGVAAKEAKAAIVAAAWKGNPMKGLPSWKRREQPLSCQRGGATGCHGEKEMEQSLAVESKERREEERATEEGVAWERKLPKLELKTKEINRREIRVWLEAEPERAEKKRNRKEGMEEVKAKRPKEKERRKGSLWLPKRKSNHRCCCRDEGRRRRRQPVPASCREKRGSLWLLDYPKIEVEKETREG